MTPAPASPPRAEIARIRPLLRFLAPYRGKIAGAVAALVLSSIAMLAFGIGLRWLVDRDWSQPGLRRFVVASRSEKSFLAKWAARYDGLTA